MSGDLAAWLLDRIAEDERTIAAILRQHPRWSVDQEQWVEGVGVVDDRDGSVAVALGDYAARHIARWDPARVLAECEAKRHVIGVFRAMDSNRPEIGSAQWHETKAIESILRLLALPYADHPDYRQEWKP